MILNNIGSTPVCKESDIPMNSSRGFDIGEHAVVIIRNSAGIFAYRNSCPHRGIRLEWQPDTFLDVEKQFIQCATHGALFTIEEGECVAGPCPGEKLEQIELEINEGVVHLAL